MSIKTKALKPYAPKGKSADVNILILSFIEDSVYYYYAPQLDIYGYGQTESEAKESFQETLQEFIRYTATKGTLENELVRLGWKVQKQNKTVNAPGLTELLRLNTELKNIVETKSFTKTHYNIQVPLSHEHKKVK